MFIHVLPLLGLLLVLIAASAFFSCVETAFFSLTRLQLIHLRKTTGWTARRLIGLLSNPRDTLIGILLGNEVANCAIAVVGAEIVSSFVNRPWQATLVSVACMTPLVLVFGEVIPKNLAVGFAFRMSPGLAVPMTFFVWLTTPLRRVLTGVADAGVRLFGGDPNQVRSMIFEEEFRQLVDMSEESGVLSESEREWIHGVFTFSDMRVKDVMTPAERVFRIPLTWSLEKIVEEMRQVQFSRVPVYQEHPDDIMGLLYVRDLISLQSRQQRGLSSELEEIIRPVLFVGGAMQVETLLREFQRTKIRMAVVRNHTQQMLGLVTLDDLFDAFIGQRKGEA